MAPKETGNDFRPFSKKVKDDRLFSLKYERVVGKDQVIVFGARSLQLPAKAGKFGYSGAKVELSHQLNGQLVVWLGEQRLHEIEWPLDYTPGQAPRRPRAVKPQRPKIYSYAGRPAVAVRP